LPIAAAFVPSGKTGWSSILVEIGESLLGIVYALIIVGTKEGLPRRVTSNV
jgi:hypothetical protein